MGYFTGKTVIITGGGRSVLSDGRCGSIGYGIATAYAKEGANLVITGRNVKKLEDAKEELERILAELDTGECGAILRAKGIVAAQDGTWLHFDYVPEEHQVRAGPADYTGRLCVIGAGLKEEKLSALFGL